MHSHSSLLAATNQLGKIIGQNCQLRAGTACVMREGRNFGSADVTILIVLPYVPGALVPNAGWANIWVGT